MGSRIGCDAKNLHDMKKFLLTIIGLCALAPSAMAQNEAPKHLRFIPLGGLPVWKEKLKKGIREGVMPAGGIPPNPVSLVSGGKVIPFKLSSEVLTPLFTLSPATKSLLLKSGDAPESPNWLSGPRPTAPLSLGVVLPDPVNKLWLKPRLLMLNDDADSFPAGTIRFVNASNKVVIVQVGGERGPKFGVAAGKASKVKPVKTGSNSIKIVYRDGKGGEREVWDNAIRVLANQRVQCFFYNSNLGKGKKAVNFLFLPEDLPVLPKAPK